MSTCDILAADGRITTKVTAFLCRNVLSDAAISCQQFFPHKLSFFPLSLPFLFQIRENSMNKCHLMFVQKYEMVTSFEANNWDHFLDTEECSSFVNTIYTNTQLSVRTTQYVEANILINSLVFTSVYLQRCQHTY